MSQEQIDQLRIEADARRQAITGDVDMLTDRVLPSRIVERQKARFSQRVSTARDSVFGTPDHRRPASSHGAGDDSGTSLAERASNATDHVKNAPGAVAEFADGNPVAAGLVGLGLGLLAATLIPASRAEQKIARDIEPQIETVATELARSGQAAVDEVKPAALAAKDEVADSAKESAHEVQEHAHGAAEKLRDTAKSDVDDLRTS